jgi:hypothetical protein
MKHFSSTVGAAVIAAVMTACGTSADSATSPKTVNLQLSATDSALVVVRSSADATLADVSLINGVASTMNWNLAGPAGSGIANGISMDLHAGASAAAGVGSGCTFNPADGRFDCPPYINENGLTVTRSLAFFDANGVLMNHFDSTTASLNVQATDVGVAIRAAGADTVNRSRNLTATGLLGHNTTRTWNGSAAGTSAGYSTDSAATRTFDLNENATFSNIVVALPRSANPYPVSGSITRLLNGSGVVTKGDSTRAVIISRTVTITFNGTEFVPMTVGSVSYTLDLATGNATRN